MDSPLRVSTGTPVVIDTSVAFKWFDSTEHGADAAEALLRAHQADEVALIAPAHLPLEIVNALACRRVALADLEDAIALIGAADLLIAPVDDALLIEAARIAHAERIALYDAAFVALAAALDAELVTADRRQAATRSCRVRLIA